MSVVAARVFGFALALLIATLALATAATANALVQVPKLEQRVTDTTGTLSPATLRALDQRLTAFEQEKGAQIGILIVATTEPEAMEQFSIRAVDQWRLGRKSIDDGALLLIAINDRKLRIEVGYGLEGALTDAKSKRIIREIIVPRFFEGDYDGGITAGVEAMIKVIDGELLPAPEGDRSQGTGVQNALPILLGVAVIGGHIMRAIFGALLGALIAGAITSVIGYFILQTIVGAAVAFVGGFLIALFVGASRSSGWSSRRHRGGYVGGGFGSGGFGGGGFSGGGGGFGGGGASGSW